jgi:hypothetical protein
MTLFKSRVDHHIIIDDLDKILEFFRELNGTDALNKKLEEQAEKLNQAEGGLQEAINKNTPPIVETGKPEVKGG